MYWIAVKGWELLRFSRIFIYVCVYACSGSSAFAVDESDMRSFYDLLIELGWNDSSDSKRSEIFDRVSENMGKLNENSDAIQQNYQDVKENEQSLANRALTAGATAATGLGMMAATSAQAEQKADADAEQDMAAYLATFKCEYGRGLTAKAGNEEITLPGGNELLEYYSEYKSLADNLKNTKQALGLRPGIEQEIVYDKAQSNLYKYSSTGITDGAFTSLSRALTDTDGADAEKWNAQKEQTVKNLKTGLIATGAGVVAGIVGNLVINANAAKDKSAELRTEREQIVADLQDVMQEAIDNCNEEIKYAKENLPSESEYYPATLDDEDPVSYAEYASMINSMQPINDISEIEKIKDIPVCK